MSVQPWRLPRRRDALSYWLRTRLLSLRAVLRQWLSHRRDKRWPVSAELVGAPVIARHRSPLWAEEADSEFALTAGKIENLRRALRAFDGVEVAAGGVLSFWAQLAPACRLRAALSSAVKSARAVLCRQSRAASASSPTQLADVATQAGLAFVERHRHSARVGAAVPQDARRDRLLAPCRPEACAQSMRGGWRWR